MKKSMDVQKSQVKTAVLWWKIRTWKKNIDDLNICTILYISLPTHENK